MRGFAIKLVLLIAPMGGQVSNFLVNFLSPQGDGQPFSFWSGHVRSVSYLGLVEFEPTPFTYELS